MNTSTIRLSTEPMDEGDANPATHHSARVVRSAQVATSLIGGSASCETSSYAPNATNRGLENNNANCGGPQGVNVVRRKPKLNYSSCTTRLWSGTVGTLVLLLLFIATIIETVEFLRHMQAVIVVYGVFFFAYMIVWLLFLYRSGWSIVLISASLKFIFALNLMAVRAFDSTPVMADSIEKCIFHQQIIDLLIKGRCRTRSEIVLELIRAGVEPNPGPKGDKVKCKKCGESIKKNLMSAHFKDKHPLPVDCKKCGLTLDLSELKQHLVSAHPFKKSENKSKIVDKQIVQETQVAQAEDDSKQEFVAIEIDKIADEKADRENDPLVKMQKELDEIELVEKLDVAERKYRTPDTGLPNNPNPNSGDGYSELGNVVIWIGGVDARVQNVLDIGAVPGLYVSPFVIRHVPRNELVYLVLMFFVNGYVEVMLAWVLNLLTLWKVPILVAQVSGVIGFWYLTVMFLCWICMVLMSFLFAKESSSGWPPLPLCWVFGHFYKEVYDLYHLLLIVLGTNRPHQIRLVGIPLGARKTDIHDRRPELDRGEHRAKLVRQDYQLAVVVEDGSGFRLYKEFPFLSKQWYVRPDAWFVDYRLLTVRLDNGLMATALNRLTLMKSKSEPHLALEACLRLVMANSAYQEDYTRLYNTGRSVYRDMALVAGAIVAKDIGHDNSAF